MPDQRAKQIIDDISYITVASVSAEGLPWNSPVFAVHDNELNFYFGTYKESQKARNILANPNVFLVVYDSTVPAGSGEGVYIQAKATAITDQARIEAAHKLLWNQHEVPYWKLEEFTQPSPLVLFKVTPEKIWMNDEGEVDGHYIDKRKEVTL